ncbi:MULTISPECIES: hypothetical protein [Rhodococcus]|uniref:hypothetical protein n=1 Tax=Rhodococcus TaxID=1827 RepID=UPI0011AFC776|nr:MULTISPECIES: hypothetical protein [Rhodococcus]WKX00262.1 hypothetical protein Q3O43_08190 [Rhodococcus aetherivorans]
METETPVVADLYFYNQDPKKGPEWAWVLIKDGKVIAVLTVKRGRRAACDGTIFPPRAVIALLCGTQVDGRVTPPLIEHACKYLHAKHGLRLVRSGLASPKGLRAVGELVGIDPVAVRNTQLHSLESPPNLSYFCNCEVRTMDEDEVKALHANCDDQFSQAQQLYDECQLELVECNVKLPPRGPSA